MVMENEIIDNRESEVAKRFGVSKPRLVGYRASEVEEGIHWYRNEPVGRRPGAVCWTDEGLRWLEAKLGSLADPEGSFDNDALMARVLQKPANPKLLVCEVDGKPVKVLVRSSERFKVGMFVPLKVITGGVYTVKKYPKLFGKY